MRRHSFFIGMISLVFFISGQSIAQVSEPSVLHALRTHEKIKLDGRLDELCWQQAEKIANFTQRELNEGEPASEKTEVAVVFTGKSLYLGFWCYDSEPDKIVAKEMKRDFYSRGEDNMEIVIDTYHARRNSYHFVINPNGARRDELVTDEGRGRNDDWNGVWDVRAKITPAGWFAEMEIPFSTLKFPNTPEQVWGINFERNISRKHEQVLWQGWSRNYHLEQVSHAGTLLGLKNISSGHLVELMPYLTAGLRKQWQQSGEGIFRAGGDLNYLVTSNLKLNVTTHTDFAQVESDRAIINLTRFSIRYPEKRGFFLEGRDAFSFGARKGLPSIFYTRRIGIKQGGQIPIIGGGRLIGKTGSTNIGALSIQTQAEGDEPTTNYSVLRLKQDIGGQSNIGIIMTAKNSADVSNYVYGVDANYVTSHLFGDKNLSVGGAITRSSTKNDEKSGDIAYQTYLTSHNDKVEYDFVFARVGKDFDPQMGFLRRKNYKLLYTELQFNPRPSFLPWVRQMEVKPIDVDAYFSDDTNELESVGWEWRPFGFGTKSGERFEYNIQRFYDRLDEDFEIHDGVILPTGGYWYNRNEIQASTYSGRKLSFDVGTSWGDYYTGRRTELEIQAKVKVNKHFNLRTDYSYNRLRFPQGDFATHEIGGRAEYAFTTKLYSSFFGQWNNEDDKILFNFRVNWIPVIGSDFYLAVNQLYDTGDGGFKLENTTILSKLIWRFTL
ncbi:MAG TPA: hypothetical protein ENH29_11275 [Bacteroidetes bacterium]|nr:hypothetical protein [Bacteroidota bacterium]